MPLFSYFDYFFDISIDYFASIIHYGIFAIDATPIFRCHFRRADAFIFRR